MGCSYRSGKMVSDSEWALKLSASPGPILRVTTPLMFGNFIVLGNLALYRIDFFGRITLLTN